MVDRDFRIKICGLTSLEDARFIAGQQADYLGFIFYEGSPRYITPEKAGAIINWIHGPKPVGVFVNRPAAEINEIAMLTGIDLVQLHGNESPEECAKVEKPLIKVFHIDSVTDADSLERSVIPYVDVVDYLMFDTKKAGQWGGTGRTFDWSLLEIVKHLKPLFLSGGIGSDNIAEAYRKITPFAFDISSSLEVSPGVKDFDKVEKLFEVADKLR